MGKKKADKTKPVVVKTKAKAKEPEVVEIFDTDDLSEDVVVPWALAMVESVSPCLTV